MTGNLSAALAAIDTANAADPKAEALVYGQRMSAELDRLFPQASDVLKIAARGQHVERWLLPRGDYPEGKEGYHAWRREQGRRHGQRVAGIMADAGYDPQDCERVGVLLRKEGIKRDSEVQALEDVICFTFLRWYFSPFAEGRARALAEFDLPEPFAAAFHG